MKEPNRGPMESRAIDRSNRPEAAGRKGSEFQADKRFEQNNENDRVRSCQGIPVTTKDSGEWKARAI